MYFMYNICTVVTVSVWATEFGTKETFRFSRIYIFVDDGSERGCITVKAA